MKMNLFHELTEKREKISVIGLGYVGLPLAVEFAKKCNVIGFDLNEGKIALYKQGKDVTNEVGEEIKKTKVEFTCDESNLSEALFHIVAVPTPINEDNTPDLRPLVSACEILGRNIQKNSVVVFESTVYPGVTEEICAPIIEKESGLKCGSDFKIGYSPERINPGDKIHRLSSIKKIVSGMDEGTLDIVAKMYELVVDAGVYRASNIKVAEAAKVIENSQRDINIAFMNELSIIFNKIGIDTKEVLEAAATKWNFMKFSPGLVGGHCIGVDPYYLTYLAEKEGYHPDVILSGRRINDNMGKYVAENTIKLMIKAGKNIKNAKVGIYGITFKENCPDIRNSKVIDIIKELNEYGVTPIISDCCADVAEIEKQYGLSCTNEEIKEKLDVVICAVAHEEYRKIRIDKLNECFVNQKILIDVKGIFDKEELEKSGYYYWRL